MFQVAAPAPGDVCPAADDPTVPDPQRRAWLLRTGAGLAGLTGAGLFGLAGCAQLPPALRNVEISQEKLLSALATQFPVQRRMLEFFDVSLSQPRLRLLPHDNRLQTEFDLGVGETLLTRKMFHGTLGFSSGVRYEGRDHTIRLARVQVDRLSIAGVPDALGGRLQAVGSLLAETLLEDISVYRMPDNVARLADALGVVPGELRITSSGLAVPFEARKS